MDDNTGYCAICCHEHKKAEMNLQRTTVYPYRRMIYVCAKCKENQDKREALKTAKKVVKRSPRFHASSLF